MSAVIISTTAATAATIASANAARQAKASCEAFMPLYEHKTATIESARMYASCVDRLYPEQADVATVIWFKVAIVLAMLGLVFGTFIGWKEDGFLGATMLGLLGALIGGTIILAIWCLKVGVMFLFS